MGRSAFDHADFLEAALALVSERGPPAVTVAAITERLGAPTGSFYHRFASRDALLGELWLNTVLDFQQGLATAFAAGDGLAAALHTPAWVREHLDEGRVLLMYHRNDFVQGDWPSALRKRVAAHVRASGARQEEFARLIFNSSSAEARRRTQFVLAEVPVAAVRQHLLRREPPPPIVDELIRTTYRAVVAAYRRKTAAPRSR